jgi:DNA-directed RNA polymerase subunit RPC12/RpoP
MESKRPMRWKCLECGAVMGVVSVGDKPQELRYGYCPQCQRFTWQRTVKDDDEVDSCS